MCKSQSFFSLIIRVILLSGLLLAAPSHTYSLALMAAEQNPIIAQSVSQPENDLLPVYIYVNTLEDELIPDGDCSLREAIQAANTNVTEDTCSAGSGTNPDIITFSVSGTITLTQELPIIINSGPLILLGGNNVKISGNNSVPIMIINADADVTIQELSLSDARRTSCPSGNHGGAIQNKGDLKITSSNFTNNKVTDNFCRGGSIYNAANGSVTIIGSKFDGGSSYGGGAVDNDGTATIKNSLIANGYGHYGGGIVNAGTVMILDTTFYHNNGGFSGGIYNTNNATIKNSIFVVNVGLGTAGALYNVGLINIENSTFSQGSGGSSGGIYNNSPGNLTINNSTFSANTSTTSGQGGSLYNNNGTMLVQNSIVAYSPSQTNCFGIITDNGFNIDSGSTCGFSPENNSQSNTDPLLEALTDNGGPTQTHGLAPGSPAINIANQIACPVTDQRGASRFGTCDIGAYEYGGSITLLTTSQNPSVFGQPVTFTAQVFEGEIGTPTGSVLFAYDGNTLGTSQLNGSAQASLTVNTLPLGNHTITTTYSGDSNFAASISQNIFQKVGFATDTSITLDEPDPSFVDQSVNIEFTVTGNPPGSGKPTGLVVVSVIGGSESCIGILSDGSGSCQITLTSPGVRTVTASYSGNPEFNGSNDAEEHQVNKADTTTTITSDHPDPSIVNQPVTINFTVSSNHPEGRIPIGSVSVTISNGSESCIGTLNNGSGSCQMILTNDGERTLMATFSGSRVFNASSDMETHTVIWFYSFLPICLKP